MSTSPKPSSEIDAEKATKPRPDLVPPRAIMAGGRAMGYGVAKHGPGRTGFGTFRDAGTEQATAESHIASFDRHWQAFKIGRRSGTTNPIDPGTGLAELDCAMAQLGMVVDLVEDPPADASDPWALPEGWEWRTSVMSSSRPWKAVSVREGLEIWAEGFGLVGYAKEKYPEVAELVRRRNEVSGVLINGMSAGDLVRR